MAEPNQTNTVNLIRAIIEHLESGTPSWNEWQSFSMVVGSFEGKLNSFGGYLYLPDGTIAAATTDTLAVLPFLNAYVDGYYAPEQPHPVALLIQFDRISGQYNIQFEDTDETRWKVTPRNINEIREELRPSFTNEQ